MRQRGMRRGLALVLVLLALASCAGADTGTDAAVTGDEAGRLLAFGAIYGGYMEMEAGVLGGIGGSDLEDAKAYFEAVGLLDHDEAVAMLDELVGVDNSAKISFDLSADDVLRICQGKMTSDALSEEEVAYLQEVYGAACDTLRARYGFTQEELDSVATMTAYDCEMIVFYARSLYAVGVIDESEAWGYIRAAAELGVTLYDSWEQYALGCLYGTMIPELEEDMLLVLDGLLEEENSAYQTYAFAV